MLNSTKRKKAYAVFEGGGVKGIGIAGALEVFERHYQWANIAGTSAGALIGALSAAGYCANQIKKLVLNVDFNKWKDKFTDVPVGGPIYNFISKYGIYRGDYLEQWIGEKLAAKNIHKFKDLICSKEEQFKYRLQVVTSDISRGRMVVLPRDLKYYGLNPDDFSVAKAVRMSCSIPFFFAPVTINYTDKTGTPRVSYFVDGGVLSNYPIWLFAEDRLIQRYPTIGFRLVGPNEGTPRKIHGPVTFLGALISTMLEAHDAKYLEEDKMAQTINIPTLGIGATDFDISQERKWQLFNSGRLAAEGFVGRWSIKYYVQRLLAK